MWIYLLEKNLLRVDNTTLVNITFSVNKSLCLPKLKPINVLFYDYSTVNKNSTFTCVVRFIFLEICILKCE